jgi:predicted DNA-binding ribbon-helix-helix protein
VITSRLIGQRSSILLYTEPAKKFAVTIKRLQSRNRRSVRINGRPTSITVELPIWDRFREVAFGLGCTYDSLLAHIDRTMRLEPPWPGHYRVRSLSSAVRIFVHEHMEAAAADGAIERALTVAANTQWQNSHPLS